MELIFLPRPILRTPDLQQKQNSEILSVTPMQTQLNSMQIDRLLRKKRSKKYMEAVHQLDAGGHVNNRQKIDEIIATVKNEFPEVELSGIFLGIVSICYLGKPYEVHTLDMTGNIITHYKAGEMLPEGMEKARGIAIHGGYDYIEVYSDCLRAVSSDGMVAVIKG